jgi:glycine/D-amino acid oxidase-like deaminating enzyme
MRAEVAVVGAGIIGILAAYELAKRGLAVLLLDAGKEGTATLASAGMLAPYPEGLSGSFWRRGFSAWPTTRSSSPGSRRRASRWRRAFPAPTWWPWARRRRGFGVPKGPSLTRCGAARGRGASPGGT